MTDLDDAITAFMQAGALTQEDAERIAADAQQVLETPCEP